MTVDRFLWLGPAGAIRLPNFIMPPLMSNHGNFVVSLGNVCRWLATKAEGLGVEIFPGFAGAELLFDENGDVVGVATGDMGDWPRRQAQGELPARFGIARPLHAYRRGRARLARQAAHRAVQACRRARAAEISASGSRSSGRSIRPSIVPAWCSTHSAGRSTTAPAGARSSITSSDNQVAVGFVVHLNYANPHLSPFEEFQRFKTHPSIRPLFDGGKRVSMARGRSPRAAGSRCRNWRFPGGALVGCAAGFVNVPRIKGSHNAILSGMLAAEHVAEAIAAGRSHDELVGYDAAWRSSDIGRDLRRVRNVKPLWSKLGTVAGIVAGGFDMWTNTFGFSLFGTLKHGKADYAATCFRHGETAQIPATKPDGLLTFDRLSSVFVSNTLHEEDQPVHLQVADMALQSRSEHDVYRRPVGALLPGRGLRVDRGRRGRAALPDQRRQLRPLQDLRHQGPQPEHQLGAAGRWRRAELPQYVRFPSACWRAIPLPLTQPCRFRPICWVTSGAPFPMASLPTSIDETLTLLRDGGYVPDRALATVLFLSLKMGRPLFLEGEAGVGKTEIAKVLSDRLGRKLIRLQCYEGLDVASAVYEWNYAAQMIEIRAAEAAGTVDRETLVSDVFTERFLIRRPLLQALDSSNNGAPVLLIDELDRADEAFEAYLLEVLADNQVTIPELGTFRAEVPPIVIVTTNRTREIHDALKRRCLYHWIDYPDAARELEIVRTKVPGAGDRLSREVVGFVQRLRGAELFKSPGVAETLDWATALTELDQLALDPQTISDTLGVLLKYQDDIARIEGSRTKAMLDEVKAELNAAE